MNPAAAPGRRAGRWWVLSLLIMLVVWFLSSQSKLPGPPLVHPLDWIAHFLTYLALGFTLGRATGRPGLALVVAAWFGALDEAHQAFVPGREAGVQDWLFDVLGAYLGSRRATREVRAVPEAAPDVPAVAVLLEFPS